MIHGTSSDEARLEQILTIGQAVWPDAHGLEVRFHEGSVALYSDGATRKLLEVASHKRALEGIESALNGMRFVRAPHVHQGGPAAPPPPDLWQRAKERCQELVRYTERTYGATEHVMALGALMLGVMLMKGTGAPRHMVIKYAGDVFDRSSFTLAPS